MPLDQDWQALGPLGVVHVFLRKLLINSKHYTEELENLSQIKMDVELVYF